MPANLRTETDVADIIACLRTFPLFSTHESRLTTREKVLIALSVGVESYSPYQAICRIKDNPNCVYFVLQGEVVVTLANPRYFTEANISGTVIAQYQIKTTFGEVGILSNTTRTANCVATSPVKLMVLPKVPFKTYIGDKIVLERKTNFQFVSSIPLFEKWTQHQVYAILTHIKISNCKHNHVIYRKLDFDNNIYIVYQGEVELLAHIPMEKVSMKKPEFMRTALINPNRIYSVD